MSSGWRVQCYAPSSRVSALSTRQVITNVSKRRVLCQININDNYRLPISDLSKVLHFTDAPINQLLIDRGVVYEWFGKAIHHILCNLGTYPSFFSRTELTFRTIQ